VDQAGRWTDVLNAICEAVDARSAVVQVLHRNGGRLEQRWCARDRLSMASAAVHDRMVNNDQNPRLDLHLASPVASGGLFRDRDRFAPGCVALNKLKERLASVGLGQEIAVVLELAPDRYFSLILHRPAGDTSDFGSNEEAYLRELVPHLEQVNRLTAKLQALSMQRAAIDAVVDRLRVGVLLCDRHGQVGWINQAAADAIERSRYLALVNDRLRCSPEAGPQILARLLANAADVGDVPAPEMIARVGSGAGALHLLALPLHVAEGNSPGPVALNEVAVLISEADRTPLISAASVAELFELSPAEARLAAALCNGESVSVYARRRGISVGTARIQLKQALAKTGTRRQLDLVRRVCGSVAAQALNGLR
jgi:DNA-binding CsgD family transcriptional regulator